MKRQLALVMMLLTVLLLSGCSFLKTKTEEIKEELAEMTSLPEVILEEETSLEEGEGQAQPALLQEPEAEGAASPQLSESELYERWSRVVGYWNSAEGRFAVPDMEDSHSAAFRYGIWDSESRDYGRVTTLTATGEQELTAEVCYPATEATELMDAQEEETLTVIIDYSGLEQDGKIRIKIGGGEWYQYMFAGNTTEEAYQTYLDNTAPQ